jgi:two-component system, LytTR family, sensor kinase
MGFITPRRCLIAIAAWLPFFVLWTGVAISAGTLPLGEALVGSLISMGSAGALSILVWWTCKRWPWPSGFRIRFYVLQIALAIAYALSWATAVLVLDHLRSASTSLWSPMAWVRTIPLGIWFYAVLAGMFHAVQTRERLQEKETLAARAEALVAAARLEALRARLNPHFLFNTLHTLAAVVKFRPAQAENAIERLGDMLRYTLKEDRRGLVEFSEEYEFTRQYLAFEQLRFEDRLIVHLDVPPDAFDFDVPPFAIQTLVENAVHHAIAIRPEGGSVWITGRATDDGLEVSVRDDGPGRSSNSLPSHQMGLRSVRERLVAAFGPTADVRVQQRLDGFEARFLVPAPAGDADPARETSS